MLQGRQGVLVLCMGVALVIASAGLWLLRSEPRIESSGIHSPTTGASTDRVQDKPSPPLMQDGASLPPPQRFVVVTTEGKIGFREGEKFYPVGMSSIDFVRQFGEPDRGIPQGGVLHYHADGLLVNTQQVGQEYRVSRFLFYTMEWGDFKAANVQTDKGIAAAHRFRHVTQAHGRPYDDTRQTRMASTMRTVHYNWGWFRFVDDEMEGISVSYMP